MNISRVQDKSTELDGNLLTFSLGWKIQQQQQKRLTEFQIINIFYIPAELVCAFILTSIAGIIGSMWVFIFFIVCFLINWISTYRALATHSVHRRFIFFSFFRQVHYTTGKVRKEKNWKNMITKKSGVNSSNRLYQIINVKTIKRKIINWKWIIETSKNKKISLLPCIELSCH